MTGTAPRGLPALVEPPVEDRLGDPVAQHLQRAAGDHPAPRAAQAVLDQRVGDDERVRQVVPVVQVVCVRIVRVKPEEVG